MAHLDVCVTGSQCRWASGIVPCILRQLLPLGWADAAAPLQPQLKGEAGMHPQLRKALLLCLKRPAAGIRQQSSPPVSLCAFAAHFAPSMPCLCTACK